MTKLRVIETIAGRSLLITGIFLLILFIAERLAFFAIHVASYNQKLIFPYEVGGVFFVMLMIACGITETIRYLLNLRKKND